MMMWSFIRFLQRETAIASRKRWVSSSIVVPTRMIRNRIRAGVTTTLVTSRAAGDTGVPIPVAGEPGDQRDQRQEPEGYTDAQGEGAQRLRLAAREDDAGRGSGLCIGRGDQPARPHPDAPWGTVRASQAVSVNHV